MLTADDFDKLSMIATHKDHIEPETLSDWHLSPFGNEVGSFILKSTTPDSNTNAYSGKVTHTGQAILKYALQ